MHLLGCLGNLKNAMNILRLIFVFIFFSFPALAQEKTFNAESFTLGNGMQVVVIPNHRAPVIIQMVWYKAGAIDETPLKSGVAHFVEHLMFKGTKKIGPGEFSKKIRAMGGNDNAFTAEDYTAYHETVSVDHLKDVMEMEADRMTGVIFPPAHFISERAVVLQERAQRTEDDPRSFFHEQLRALLFVNHPYGSPVIGWRQEVENLKREDVLDFYHMHYTPNNAILVISGDVTAAQVKPLAEKTYGKIKNHDIPPRQWTEVPPLNALPRLVLHDQSVRQPILMRVWRAPAYTQNKEDSLALQVLENIMDGGSATRLYKSLVVEQKVAVNIGFGYDSSALSDGTVSISATPVEGVPMEKLESAADDALRAVIRDGVTDQELREAKDRLKDAAVFARDSINGPANIFGQALATGETIDDVEYWPENIERVTAAQVQDVARRFLDPDHYGMQPYVTGWLLPEENK